MRTQKMNHMVLKPAQVCLLKPQGQPMIHKPDFLHHFGLRETQRLLFLGFRPLASACVLRRKCAPFTSSLELDAALWPGSAVACLAATRVCYAAPLAPSLARETVSDL